MRGTATDSHHKDTQDARRQGWFFVLFVSLWFLPLFVASPPLACHERG